MLGTLFLLVGCVGFFVICGAIYIFSLLLFSRRRRMGYGYSRRRAFFPRFFGRSFEGEDFYERRSHYEHRPQYEHHHEHHGGGGFGGGHHHGGGGGFDGGHGGHH